VERMVQEAQTHGRIAFVAGANQRLKERLGRFGVNAVMTDRLDALRRASEHLSQ
jgi:SulP family sulfate permease